MIDYIKVLNFIYISIMFYISNNKSVDLPIEIL
jgi:hypothetical protein